MQDTDACLFASGRVELRKALARIRRERPSRATIVWTYDKRKADDNLPVIEVPEGTILTLVVYSGIPFLHIASGRLVYRACSSWGNSLTVHGGEVHVMTDGGERKVTITVEPGDTTPIITAGVDEQGEGTRLRWFDPSHRELPLGTRPQLPAAEVDEDFIPLAWTS